jgi:PAS domain-containing protein
LSETGRVEDFETPIRRSDSSVIEVSMSANRVEMDGTGYILTSIRDITIRKEAQAQLKRSRARLRDLQHLAQLGTWELNVATGEVRWSDETFRIAGRDIEHGAPDMNEYLKTVHPEDRQQLRDAIALAITHHTAYELQLRHLKPDGSYNTVIARGQPNLDESGNVIEIYGIVIDITRQADEINQLKQQVTCGETGEPDALPEVEPSA